MRQVTIGNCYVKSALEGAVKKGYDQYQLLEEAGIDPEILTEDKSRIPAFQVSKLIRILWETMNDEFLGRTRTPGKRGSFYLMAELIIQYSNLEDVLQQSIRCYTLLHDDIKFGYELVDDQVRLSIDLVDPELDSDHFLINNALIVWHRFLGWLIGKNIVLSKASFKHDLMPSFDEYKFAFSCDCAFNRSQNSLYFSQNYLSMPVIRNRNDLAKYIRETPTHFLVWTGDEKNYSTKLRAMLENKKYEILPSLEEAAEWMNTTPHTLHRKLKTEGTSYQQIKDNFRRDNAIYLLTKQNYTISEIAEKLDFSESGAFSRAFKQWTGLSPLAYKKRN